MRELEKIKISSLNSFAVNINREMLKQIIASYAFKIIKMPFVNCII